MDDWLDTSARSADVSTANRRLLWIGIVLVGGFELWSASLILRPNADPVYRAYFIDKTSDCWPHLTDGDYALGKSIGFLLDWREAADRIKICGWFYPDNTGTWSYGAYSRLRTKFATADMQLTLTITAGAMVSAAHPEQRVMVSANGTRLGTLSFTSGELEAKSIDIPQSIADLGVTGLDWQFDYPDARPGTEMGAGTDPHPRALRLVAIRIAPRG
jgi:hypothetical protein